MLYVTHTYFELYHSIAVILALVGGALHHAKTSLGNHAAAGLDCLIRRCAIHRAIGLHRAALVRGTKHATQAQTRLTHQRHRVMPLTLPTVSMYLSF